MSKAITWDELHKLDKTVKEKVVNAFLDKRTQIQADLLKTYYPITKHEFTTPHNLR